MPDSQKINRDEQMQLNHRTEQHSNSSLDAAALKAHAQRSFGIGLLESIKLNFGPGHDGALCIQPRPDYWRH